MQQQHCMASSGLASPTPLGPPHKWKEAPWGFQLEECVSHLTSFYLIWYTFFGERKVKRKEREKEEKVVYFSTSITESMTVTQQAPKQSWWQGTTMLWVHLLAPAVSLLHCSRSPYGSKSWSKKILPCSFRENTFFPEVLEMGNFITEETFWQLRLL